MQALHTIQTGTILPRPLTDGQLISIAELHNEGHRFRIRIFLDGRPRVQRAYPWGDFWDIYEINAARYDTRTRNRLLARGKHLLENNQVDITYTAQARRRWA